MLPKNMKDRCRFDILEIVAWICALVALSPAILWLSRGLVQSGQLREAMIIMVSALLVLAVEYGVKPHRPRFSRSALAWLCGAYAMFFCAQFMGVWGALAILAALSMAIVAAGLACFDKPRYVYAAGGAFYAFTLLSFAIKLIDFPLRVWAGLLASKILSIFDKTSVILAGGGSSPQIAMQVDGNTYLVATECNGFGIISSCFILSVLMAIFLKGLPVWKRFLVPAAAVIFAYLANSMRIAAIIATATYFDKSRYDLIHEFWGYLFFALALISVWMMFGKGGEKVSKSTRNN